MTTQEPEWIPLTTVGSAFEVEMDVRAIEGSARQYRHRPFSFTGEDRYDWTFGEPDPREKAR